MARKGPRALLRLRCQECENTNYTTEKSKTNTPDKLELRKFCRHCKKHTVHGEYAKLK